jgi:hypothetical protein
MLHVALSLCAAFTPPSWAPAPTALAPRVSGHATSVDGDGRVWLFGGLTDGAGSPCSRRVYAFDEPRGWTEVETAGEGPGPRMYATSTVVGTSLYVLGGWDPEAPGTGGTFKDEAWRLNLESRRWEALTPLPCGAVSRHTACRVGTDIVLHTFRGVFVLDGATGDVREQPTSGDGPVGLSMCAAAPLGEAAMLIFGGSTKTQGMSADTFVLDTRTWKWRRLRAEGAAVPTARGSACAAPIDDTSCLLFGGAGLGGGGYDGGAGLTAFSETWRVHVDGDVAVWELVATGDAEPPARVAASLNQLPSGQFLLQGGWDPKSKATFETPNVLTI